MMVNYRNIEKKQNKKYQKPKHPSKINQIYSTESIHINVKIKNSFLSEILATSKLREEKQKYSLLVLLDTLSQDNNLLRLLELWKFSAFINLLKPIKIQRLKIQNDYITSLHNILTSLNNNQNFNNLIKELEDYYPLINNTFFSLKADKLVFYKKEEMNSFLKHYDQLKHAFELSHEEIVSKLNNQFSVLIQEERDRFNLLYKLANTKRNNAIRQFKNYLNTLNKFLTTSKQQNLLHKNFKNFREYLCDLNFNNHKIKDTTFILFLTLLLNDTFWETSSKDTTLQINLKQLKAYFQDLHVIFKLLFLTTSSISLESKFEPLFLWLKEISFPELSKISSPHKIENFLSKKNFIIITNTFAFFTEMLLKYFLDNSVNSDILRKNLMTLFQDSTSNTPEKPNS